MSKSDVGAGLGVAALMAVCCAGPFLLLALVGSGLAILTGQTVLIAAAILVAVALGVYAWRRVSQCATGICAPRVEPSTPPSLSEAFTLTETPAAHEPVAAGTDGKP